MNKLDVLVDNADIAKVNALIVLMDSLSIGLDLIGDDSDNVDDVMKAINAAYISYTQIRDAHSTWRNMNRVIVNKQPPYNISIKRNLAGLDNDLGSDILKHSCLE